MSSVFGLFIKNQKEHKNTMKQDIEDTFIKANQLKWAFSIMWLMENLSTYLEEQLLIKYYAIKHRANM